MPWVWLVFANVKVMTKLSCQCLVEEHIQYHKPPGEREASENKAQRDVDQQLSKVMGTRNQLKPTSLWHSVSQRFHCSCMTRQKTRKSDISNFHRLDWFTISSVYQVKAVLINNWSNYCLLWNVSLMAPNPQRIISQLCSSTQLSAAF